MRVVVTQFVSKSTTQENLESCVRIINEAAGCKPSIIVLPEYANTLFCPQQASYLDHNQAWHEALAIGGLFLQEIAAQAKKHTCYIVINVTLQQDSSREHQNGTVKSNISVSTCLFSPSGTLIHQQDKQDLLGDENDYFIGVSATARVIATSVGKLGLLTGNDSMTFETSRDLASAGAQLLCNTMNTFAIDQSRLHDAARACENKVYVASANKVGSLLAKASDTQTQGNVDPEYLVGAGQSQIISPEGRVLAQINHHEEGFVFADINLDETEVGLNNKVRPDGTSVIKQYRAELYQPNSVSEKLLTSIDVNDRGNVPLTANVVIFATYKANEEAINDVCHYIENNLSDIIQLPELFFIQDLQNTKSKAQRTFIAELSKQVINKISAVLRPFQYVCTSVIIDDTHQGVIINERGIFAMQAQLHFCKRYPWVVLGDKVNAVTLPLEQGNIKLAMLIADDANIAEIVKVSALQKIHLLLVPFDIQEPCEVKYSLLSRAVENRICIVAASREKSFANALPTYVDENNIYSKNKVKFQKSTGVIVNLTADMDLLAQWQSRKFIGYVNEPVVKQQYGKITKAVIHPFAAVNKANKNK